jgi:hypothetical protein
MNKGKFQIPKFKFQTNPKTQIPNSKLAAMFGSLGFWSLEFIWDLEFKKR